MSAPGSARIFSSCSTHRPEVAATAGYARAGSPPPKTSVLSGTNGKDPFPLRSTGGAAAPKWNGDATPSSEKPHSAASPSSSLTPSLSPTGEPPTHPTHPATPLTTPRPARQHLPNLALATAQVPDLVSQLHEWLDALGNQHPCSAQRVSSLPTLALVPPFGI